MNIILLSALIAVEIAFAWIAIPRKPALKEWALARLIVNGASGWMDLRLADCNFAVDAVKEAFILKMNELTLAFFDCCLKCRDKG